MSNKKTIILQNPNGDRISQIALYNTGSSMTIDTQGSAGLNFKTVQEKPMQGEVIAVGPGVRDESGKLVPLDVKKGDRVLFGKWSGTEVKIDGEELAIMKESDIFGVIEGKASARAAA